MVARIPTVDKNLLQLLEKRELLGDLDSMGQKLLTTLRTEQAAQEQQLALAKDDVKELNVVSKQMQIEKAVAEAEAFKSSASGLVINNAVYTPGYVNAGTMPQINTALANYNTLVANNPVLVTDAAQEKNLPFTRKELFTLGRKTKEVEVVEKGAEVVELEKVTTEYEYALKEKHGKDFKCELVTEDQLKEVKPKSGRDILHFMEKDPGQKAKLPPEVERTQNEAQGKDAGARSF